MAAAFTNLQNQLRQMESASGQATSKMVTGLQQLAQQTTRTHVEQGNLSKAFLQTGQAAQTQMNQFQRLQQQYLRTEEATDQFGRGLSRLRTSLSSLGVTVGIAGLVQLTRSIVDAGLQMDRFQRQLTTATGSLTGAQQAFSFITAESNRLGQSVQTMVPVFTQLTAATRGTTLEGEKTLALFSALAGAGVSVGLSTVATGRAMVGLIQIISQNAIQLDEFRNQFSSQIPGAMRETARALGDMGVTARGSITEMLGLIEKGTLPVETLMTAVTTGLQAVQAAAPAMADSVEAAFNRFSNDVFQLKADVARSGLLELFGEIAKAGGDALYNAGQVLGISAPNVSRDIQHAQKELSVLLATRQEYQAVADRARSQGLIPESELMKMSELDQRIEGVVKRLQALQDQSQSAERAAKTAGDIVARERRAAADEEKRFFDERKQRESALQAAPGVLQAEGQATAARLQGNLDAIRRHYAEQRQMAMQFAQEQLQEAPREAQAIGAAREAALQQLQQREAQALLAGRETIANQELAVQQRVLTAQIAAAGDAQDKIAVLEAKRPALLAAHEATIADIRADRAALDAKTAEQGTAAIEKELATRAKAEEQHAAQLVKLEQQRLQGRISGADAEMALVRAQIDGEVVTYQDGMAQIRSIQDQRLEDMKRLYELEAESAVNRLKREVTDTQDRTDEIVAIYETRDEKIRQLDVRRATEEQTLLNRQLREQERDYERFVERVENTLGDFLFKIFDGQIKSIKDLFESLKSSFFRMIADMIAFAAARPITVLITGVLSSIAGAFSPAIGQALTGALGLGTAALGGGAGGAGSGGIGTLEGVGLLTSMRTIAGGFNLGLTNLTDTLVGAGSRISTAFGGPALYGPGFVGPIPEGGIAFGGAGGPAGSALGRTAGTVAGVAGGALAIGGGIYGALNASNTSAQAAYAASAAAGAFSVAAGTGLLAAAGATAATTGWTGYGLIAAAVLAVIGTILDQVISPKGPRLNFGELEGLGVGLGDGTLGLTGDLTSSVRRRELVTEDATNDLQGALESSVTEMVRRMVEGINQIALDPAALLRPTQEALDLSLANALKVNSSSAKNMERDLEEQLKFIPLQIATFFLAPLNDAFNQLKGQDLTSQLTKLPETVGNLVGIWGGMTDELDELMTTLENSDVRRRVAEVYGRLNRFADAVVATAGDLADEMVMAVEGLGLDEQIQRLPQAAASLAQTFELLNTGFAELGDVQPGLQAFGATVVEGLAGAAELVVSRVTTELHARMQTLLTQSAEVQALSIGGTFAQPIAALRGLSTTRDVLGAQGLDTSAIQAQFVQLVTQVVQDGMRIVGQSFLKGDFGEFLITLGSIPDEIAALNPAFAELKGLGSIFAQVAIPVAQHMVALQTTLMTLDERLVQTSTRMADLNGAIAQAGTNVSVALPLMQQLGQLIMANAELEIQAAREAHQAQIDAIQEQIEAYEHARDVVREVIDLEREAQMEWLEFAQGLRDTLAEQLEQVRRLEDTVSTTLRTEASPARQVEQLRAGIDRQEALLGGGTLTEQESIDAMTELVALNEELLQLGKDSNVLAWQKEALDSLASVEPWIAAWEEGMSSELSALEMQIAAADATVATLDAILEASEAQWAEQDQQFAAQLEAVQKSTALDEQIRAIQQGALDALHVLNTQIQALFNSQQVVQQSLMPPVAVAVTNQPPPPIVNVVVEPTPVIVEPAPVVVTSPPPAEVAAGLAPWLVPLVHELYRQVAAQAQQGGMLRLQVGGAAIGRQEWARFQQGAMVPAMLEPGERVYTPPMSHAQQGALMAMNLAFPRFGGGGWTVPGHGSGDTVPAMLPAGSFVLNRRASGSQGYQEGGEVSSRSGGAKTEIHHHHHRHEFHYDFRGVMFRSKLDAETVVKILQDYEKDRFRTDQR